MKMNRLVAAVSVLMGVAGVPALGQDTGTTSERKGPEVQAEGQDVPGGLEAEPSEKFSADEHLLGDLFGSRKALADKGISIDPVLTLDYVKNFHGGRDTGGSAYLHLFDLSITVETEPLFGHKGGSFYVDMFTQHGQSPSDEAGDYALIDELDFGGRTEVSEIWYEQKLLDDKVRVKLGKIDANTEFCFVENSFDFSNGEINYGFPVTQFNFMPTAPDTAFGGVVFVYPTEMIYAGGGVFDGALQEGVETGTRGPKTLFDDPGDLYIVGEVGLNLTLHQNPVRVAVGAAYHTGTFTDFGGGTQDGNTGYYALLDAQLWKENPGEKDDKQGIGAFFVYDTADSDVTDVDQHFTGGVAWTGAIPKRDDDVVGIGAGYSHFAGTQFTEPGELAVEAYYKIALTKFLTVRADVQYIKDPGGAGLTDALVGLVRVEVAF